MVQNQTALKLLQMIRKGGNPQQLVISMLEGQSANNPMLKNLLDLANSNDGNKIESFARNIVNSQGGDFDTEFNSFKQMLGL